MRPARRWSMTPGTGSCRSTAAAVPCPGLAHGVGDVALRRPQPGLQPDDGAVAAERPAGLRGRGHESVSVRGQWADEPGRSEWSALVRLVYFRYSSDGSLFRGTV